MRFVLPYNYPCKSDWSCMVSIIYKPQKINSPEILEAHKSEFYRCMPHTAIYTYTAGGSLAPPTLISALKISSVGYLVLAGLV